MTPGPIKSLLPLLTALLLLALSPFGAAADEAASATLLWVKGQERQRLALCWNGEVLRIDQADKRFTVLYREKDGLVTGLEARDGLYWKFEWPKLSIILKERRAVAAHYSGQSGLLGESFAKNSEGPAEKPPIVWGYRSDPNNPDNDKHRNDLPFFLETPIGGGGKGDLLLVARCATEENKAQTALWLRFAKVAEIIRTVALRELGPTGLSEPVASLSSHQITPVEFRTEFHKGFLESVALLPETWMTGEHAENADNPIRFAPPKSFHETTLTPLEELLGSAPPESPSGPAPTANLEPVQKESGQ